MGKADVFVDTSGLIALARKRDSLHAAAVVRLQELAVDRARFVTSEWVLAEFLSSVSHPRLRVRGASMVRQLQASSLVMIAPASTDDFARALSFYESRRDKGWSFVDCSSIMICEARSITRVFTHDQHFAQAGLTVLHGS